MEMNPTTMDLITLRMIICSTRNNMTAIRRDTTKRKEFERYAKLMEKYQAWHIQKVGEIYTR